MGTYFYRNTERRNPETERDCGQKGSYNKAGVSALGSNARHGQAGKSSYKNERRNERRKAVCGIMRMDVKAGADTLRPFFMTIR